MALWTKKKGLSWGRMMLMAHLKEAVQEHQLKLPQLRLQGVERQPSRHGSVGVTVLACVGGKLQLYQRGAGTMAKVQHVPIRMALQGTSDCEGQCFHTVAIDYTTIWDPEDDKKHLRKILQCLIQGPAMQGAKKVSKMMQQACEDLRGTMMTA